MGFVLSEHANIREIQEPLNFLLTVYGLGRFDATNVKITHRHCEALCSHVHDLLGIQ
jgi:hypothetical protein